MLTVDPTTKRQGGEPHLKYFDYAATTPPHPDVVRTMAEIMDAQYGNPSSIHGYGERAHQLLRRARSGCAAAIDVKPEEIVFTSGATESNNLAIKGAALQYQSRGKHIITTATEHASVYESFVQLQQWGWEVTWLPVDSDGLVSAQQVMDAIRADTVLVSLMHVNNETGAIHPVAEIGARLKKKRQRSFSMWMVCKVLGKWRLNLRHGARICTACLLTKFVVPKELDFSM